jgi:hypothetical protein
MRVALDQELDTTTDGGLILTNTGNEFESLWKLMKTINKLFRNNQPGNHWYLTVRPKPWK